MKIKLKFLTKQSINKKIKSKWFKGVNILLCILFIIIVNIDTIITSFGGDFEDEIMIYVEDNVGGYPLFSQTFFQMADTLGDAKNYKLEKVDKEYSFYQETLEENLEDVYVKLNGDPDNYLQAEIISFNEVGTVLKQLISSTVNSLKSSIAISTIGLKQAEVAGIMMPANIVVTTLNPEIENVVNKELISSVLILIFILPCFFLIIMLVQMIGAEVNDEKTTRSMEIIISNVSPKVHFLSKIFASTSFVVLQGLLLVFYGIIALLSRGLFSNGSISGELTSQVGELLTMIEESGAIFLLLQGLPFILVLFVFSFVAYAIVAGVLASMTTSTEDFQQLQTPIILIIMVGYYLALMASQFEGALFIKIMSYVPMLSFMLSPTLFMMEQISILELGLSTFLTIIFTIIIFKYGLRIYKVGILNYSSSKLWKKMFRSLKSK